MDKTDTVVTNYEMWLFLICSLRYAMGRRSAVVSDVIESIDKHFSVLPRHQQLQIIKEIVIELRLAEDGNKTLGDPMDHKAWRNAVNVLCKKYTTLNKDVISPLQEIKRRLEEIYGEMIVISDHNKSFMNIRYGEKFIIVNWEPYFENRIVLSKNNEEQGFKNRCDETYNGIYMTIERLNVLLTTDEYNIFENCS